MGRFLRRGGSPGKPARRGRVVLAAIGAAGAFGAVAVDLFALTASHDPARATGSPAPGRTASPVPTSAGVQPAEAASIGTGGQPAASAQRQIILPDLLIVAPSGLATG